MLLMDSFAGFSTHLVVLLLSVTPTDTKIVRKMTTFDLYFDKTSPGQRMVPRNIYSKNFDTCKKTVFVVTGFDQPDNHPSILKAARSLAVKQYNTIVVNFDTLEFLNAPMNTGRDIAEFLEYLTDSYNLDRKNIILLGVSLGTHVVGVAGNLFPGIGRIVAIDPSGPVYDLMPKTYRITKSSAMHVDVLHCSKVMGSLRSDVGHVNFILDGGWIQPGCPWIQPGKKYPNFVCHHLRGAYLMLASLESCEFKFTKCSSYVKYRMGLCKKEPKLVFGMGQDVDSAPHDGSFYYHDVTQLKYPFCTDTERVNPDFNGMIC